MAGEAQILAHRRNAEESTGARWVNYAKQSQFSRARAEANTFAGKGLWESAPTSRCFKTKPNKANSLRAGCFAVLGSTGHGRGAVAPQDVIAHHSTWRLRKAWTCHPARAYNRASCVGRAPAFVVAGSTCEGQCPRTTIRGERGRSPYLVAPPPSAVFDSQPGAAGPQGTLCVEVR
jgi:hypothetical protein